MVRYIYRGKRRRGKNFWKISCVCQPGITIYSQINDVRRSPYCLGSWGYTKPKACVRLWKVDGIKVVIEKNVEL